MSELTNLSLSAARSELSRGNIDVLEYIDAFLLKIERVNPAIHAFLEYDPDRVRDKTIRLKSKWKRRNVPPLFGIPFAVKDNIDVEGEVTTCQSFAASHRAAPVSADCVSKLVAAGAIYIGKTSLDEFALGEYSTDKPWPRVRNPWNPEYFAGSSSAGSGAAIAARLVPFAIGTDSGGSIRSPAMMNGVVGLKPSFGRLSMEGIFPLAPSMDTVGPLAQTVADISIVFNCMLGGEVSPMTPQIKPPKLVRLDHLWRRDQIASADVASLFDCCMDELASAGAKLVEREVSSLDSFNSVGWTTLFAEAFEIHLEGLRACPQKYGRPLIDNLLTGAFIPSADYIFAQRARNYLRKQIDECLEDMDAIVTPVCALPTCNIDDKEALAALAKSSVRVMCNVTGHPALALPIGFSSQGLPIGIQLIGKYNNEHDLLAVGAWMERHLSSWTIEKRPDLAGDVSARGT